MSRELPTLDRLEAGVIANDRMLLARAITLIESALPDHQALAGQLLLKLLPHTGGAHRIGITGVPGVGKSTLLEALGLMLTGMGLKVAVLAVDPSSTRTGGAILGDKTRMQNLSLDPSAFIRPSPSSGTLGGVAKKTRETMALCEAAGFDVILVETVGVGQSEIAVADMVDCFVCLMLPGAGDELQGIKKGVLECADLIVVNKADGDQKLLAEQAASDYRSALPMLAASHSDWRPEVLTVSGLKNEGLDQVWATIQAHKSALTASGEWDEKRRTQDVRWMHDMVADKIERLMRDDDKLRTMMEACEGDVRAGRLPPGVAAQRIFEAFSTVHLKSE